MNGSSSPNAAQKAIQKDINRQQREIDAFYMDSALINNIVEGKYDEEELQREVEKKYFIFFYKIAEPGKLIPVFWNTQVIEPDSALTNDPNGISFQKLVNGWYVVNARTFRSSKGAYYKSIFLIPVKWNYYIENKYLHNSFVAERNIEKTYDISIAPTRHMIKDEKTNRFFIYANLVTR